jgi:hypothetical protein
MVAVSRVCERGCEIFPNPGPLVAFIDGALSPLATFKIELEPCICVDFYNCLFAASSVRGLVSIVLFKIFTLPDCTVAVLTVPASSG